MDVCSCRRDFWGRWRRLTGYMTPLDWHDSRYHTGTPIISMAMLEHESFFTVAGRKSPIGSKCLVGSIRMHSMACLCTVRLARIDEAQVRAPQWHTSQAIASSLSFVFAAAYDGCPTLFLPESRALYPHMRLRACRLSACPW